jgi:hypothetical protein
MALPTDANVELVLCDAARAKPDGKIDIAGYFPIPEVKLDPSAPLPAAINMTFLFVVKDGEGQFRGVFRILDPLGTELHRHDIREFSKQTGLPHLIILAISRIPIVNAGNFCALLELEGQEYRRSVRIFQ